MRMWYRTGDNCRRWESGKIEWLVQLIFGIKMTKGVVEPPNSGIWYPIFRVLYSKFLIRYSLFNVLYSKFFILCSLFRVLYSIFFIQCSVFSVLYSVFFIRCSLFDLLYSKFLIRCSLFFIQSSLFDITVNLSYGKFNANYHHSQSFQALW